MGAWRVAPQLPAITMILYLPFTLQQVHPLFSFVGFLTAVFYIGYVGTERLWYAAIWAGKSLELSTVWQTSWSYWGRYFRLGLLLIVVTIALSVPLSGLYALLGWTGVYGQPIYFIIPVLLTDIWMTFMTPALAYSTESTKEGASIEWRFLKGQGQRVAWYAATPPLVAVILLQRTPPEDLDMEMRIGLSAVAGLAHLALKGATAAKYLRHHEISAEPATSVLREVERTESSL